MRKIFRRYHRVLSRAVWSNLEASRILLMILVSIFVPSERYNQQLKRRHKTRSRLDAALYEPAPNRQPGTMGRPPLKGRRLPNLEHISVDPNTHWQTVIVNNWYGMGKREVEICSGTAVWYHTAKPVVPIRWVLIRDPKGKWLSSFCDDKYGLLKQTS
jgi:hypothetical protein